MGDESVRVICIFCDRDIWPNELRAEVNGEDAHLDCAIDDQEEDV